MANKQDKVQQWTGYDLEGNEYHNGFGRTKALGTQSLKNANPNIKFVQVEKYEPLIDECDNALAICEAEVMHIESLSKFAR